jgi:hypothetical protein
MRYIVTGGILLATVAWLVLSYMPETVVLLPKLAFDSPALAALFPWLALLTLAVFLIIQFDLVRSTGRWFRQPTQTSTARAIVEFDLSRRWELLWTVLPVVGTALLAIWLVIAR